VISLIKDVVVIITMIVLQLPLGIVTDIVTLGGKFTNAEKSYTIEALEKIMDTISNCTCPFRDCK